MKPRRLLVGGFGAFAKTAIIDFDRLSEHGLYLIIGETGAGKTTIFDAMTFALYGEVAGYREKSSVVSDYEHRDKAYVEFAFSHKERNFLIKRDIESAKPADHSITEVDSVGNSIRATTGKAEVKKFIEELVGLDSDQFMKVVLLPQGEFQKFLNANSSEREKLLQVLFGTVLYNKISESMVERSDEKILQAKSAIQVLQTRENSAQQFLDGLPEYGFVGKIPRLENGYEEVVGDLHKRRKVAEDSVSKLGTVHTEAAKKLQAVTEEAELFDAAADLAKLIEARQRFTVAVKEANSALKYHDIAKPISGAFKAEQDELEKYSRAKNELHKLDNLLSGIIGSNKTEKLISEIGNARLKGIASLNAYIANTIAVIEKAQLKYEEAFTAQSSVEDALNAIQICKEREIEIKRELSKIAPQLTNGLAAQTKQQSAVKNLSSLKSKAIALEKRLTLADVPLAKSELKVADAEFGRASKSYNSARIALQSAHMLRTKHLAGELGSSLKVGGACPVCGSTSHPQKAKKTKSVNINVLEAKRTSAQTKVERAENELKRCQVQLKKASEAFKRLPTKEAQGNLRADLKEATQASRVLEKTTKLVANLTSQVSTLEIESAALSSNLKGQKRIVLTSTTRAKDYLSGAMAIIAEDHIKSALKALGEVSRLIKKFESAEKEATSTKSKAQQASLNLQKALHTSGFETLQAGLTAVLSDAQVGKFMEVITESDARQKKITGLEGRINGKNIPLVRPDIKSAEAKLYEAQTSSARASKLANATSQAIDFVESLVNEQATEGVRVRADLEFAERAAVIAKLFKTGKFASSGIIGLERWVQRRFFQEVCNVANLHIPRLLNDRYLLTLNPLVDGKEKARAGGLDLYVIDIDNGKRRPVQSLSGGESFLVSLALALSLAEVVQSVSGGLELTSLFIDEGFGGLDSKTVESAVTFLDSIRSDGRSIGIITHVEQMINTLPIGMKIHKTSRGSSVEQTDSLSVIN